MSLQQLKSDLNKLKNPEKAKILQGFFKTGKGEYGEGDIFLGITVPQSRKIAIKFKDISLNEVEELLHSKIHEERFIALCILVIQFEENSERRKEIFDFYLANTKWINNWDLIDLTAPKIVGRYIFENGRKNHFIEGKLVDLANSNDLWEKRIAILSTFWFIKNKRFAESLEIAKILLNDKHDLIHKAVGWMLREIGKRDLKAEENFLNKYYKIMPRTMLRYAIERFDADRKRFYMD